MTDLKAIVAKEKGIIFGTGKTVKNLKTGKAKKVFIASDCAENVKKDIERYAKFKGVEVEHLTMPSDEIGMICKKPFPVSVLSY